MKRPTNAVLLGPAHPYRGGLADFDHLLARALNRAGIPCRLYTFTLQYPSFLFPGKSQFTDAPAPEGLDITRVLKWPRRWVPSAGSPDAAVPGRWQSWITCSRTRAARWTGC